MSETLNSLNDPNGDEERASFVRELMSFAMGSAAEAREWTPELMHKEQTARKMELLQVPLVHGDAEQAQRILNVMERCEQITWAIQDNPWIRIVNPYNALAKTIYGDGYNQQSDLPLSVREERQAMLGRLEVVTDAFSASLSPRDISEDGLDGTDLFLGVMRILYPSREGYDNSESIQRIHDLALAYFTAGGGFERVSSEQLR